MVKRSGLREGFTTGSAAAAAAKAGIMFLLSGWRGRTVDIPLPPPHEGRLTIPLASVESAGRNAARAAVLKDGGDDPDATHGARIECLVTLVPDRARRVAIDGGRGVGRVTLPGLPVPVGQAAINPAPLSQIGHAVIEALEGSSYGASVLVEVPDGEALAVRTLNRRLGIVGGISILGTGGIVRPYSHASYEASIRESLDVAKATGQRSVCLTTGRRGERFVQAARPDLPELALVQAADFFAFATAEAAKRGFKEIGWAVFIGKLVKQAQGYAYTHAREAEIDFRGLAEFCRRVGLTEERVREIEGAVMARRVLEILKDSPEKWDVYGCLMDAALRQARRLAGPGPRLLYYLFDFDGALLMSKEDE